MSRRYEPGIHPAYDEELRYLTGPTRPNYEFLAMRDHSKAGVQRVLFEFQAMAERRQQEIEALDLKFKNLKVTARREGRSEPAEMPRQLLEEKLRLEAQIDVISERAAQFKQELVEVEAREQEAEQAKILQYGPKGSGKMRDGVLSIIDGQPIRVNRKGVLVINCPQSPYHKMLVEDYRTQVVVPFAKARAEKSRELEDLIAAKDGELRQLKKMRIRPGLHIIAREDLPPRPAGY